MAEKHQPKLNGRQKRLIELLPQVEAGKKTKRAALLEAGYAESTAREQSRVLGTIGNNARMQAALRKAGFTEDYLAKGIVEGTAAIDMLKPDHRTRALFYKLGADLLDVAPVKKVADVTPPQNYGTLQSKAAKSADEARRMAEEAGDEDEED